MANNGGNLCSLVYNDGKPWFIMIVVYEYRWMLRILIIWLCMDIDGLMDIDGCYLLLMMALHWSLASESEFDKCDHWIPCFLSIGLSVPPSASELTEAHLLTWCPRQPSWNPIQPCWWSCLCAPLDANDLCQMTPKAVSRKTKEAKPNLSGPVGSGAS